MPNHVTNQIKAPLHVIKSLLNSEGNPDFSMVIPRPKILDGFEPHHEIIMRAEMACGMTGHGNDLINRMSIGNATKALTEKVKPEDIEHVIKAIQCYKETGHFYWHDWNIANWGTKWNAYSFDDSAPNDIEIRFDTAWSMPVQIAKALSEKFPDDEIEWKFADEDTGSNCGTIILIAGKIKQENCAPNYSEQSEDEKRSWREFAFRLRYKNANPADHGMDENFNYTDE